MKKIILILCLSSLVSCVKVDDDTDEICKGDCTTFKGKISLIDGGGISNVPVTLKYFKDEEGKKLYIRRIANVKTNKEGAYEINAYIKDDELGDTPGYFALEVDEDKLNASIPSNYIKLNELTVGTSPDKYIDLIKQRNLVFENNFIVPLKANLKINLVGFSPTQQGDHFMVSVYFDYGISANSTSSFDPNNPSGAAIDTFTTINTFTALNAKTTIFIYKRKNGVSEKLILDEKFFNEVQSNELTYYY